MTRNDYIKVSKALARASVERLSISPKETRDHLIDDLADMMAKDNPKFKRDRFISECGI